jgi:hypothetical protein
MMAIVIIMLLIVAGYIIISRKDLGIVKFIALLAAVFICISFFVFVISSLLSAA